MSRSKVFISILVFSYFVFPLFGQKDSVKYWTKGGFSLLTFNQVSLKNWAAGGDNAFSATGILNLFANYKKKDFSMDNNIDLRYGKLFSNGQMRKNDDKIEVTSKIGYKAVKSLYYSVLLNYKSQFTNGMKYVNDTVVQIVSKFNAPGYLNFSIGMDLKPANFLSIFLSPVAGKFTFVHDKALSDRGAYGIDKGKTLKPEFGASFAAKFQKDVMKNVSVSTTGNLFNNYTDKDKDNRQNIDVNWEAMINIKAGKYLTTTLLANVLYDQNTIAKTQVKEGIGVGVSYKF